MNSASGYIEQQGRAEGQLLSLYVRVNIKSLHYMALMAKYLESISKAVALGCLWVSVQSWCLIMPRCNMSQSPTPLLMYESLL